MSRKHGGYEITETGLVVRDGWTPELWEAAGHEIARYQKGLMWLIGDWLNPGDREQARIIYHTARQMVEMDPYLASRVKVYM